MITVERFDVFKEAMNASYIPGQAAQAGSNAANQSDFMKTFEKTSYDDPVNIDGMNPGQTSRTAANDSDVNKDVNKDANKDVNKDVSQDVNKDVNSKDNPKTDARDKQAEKNQGEKNPEKADGEKNGEENTGDKVDQKNNKEQEQEKTGEETSTQKNSAGKTDWKASEKSNGKYENALTMKDLLKKHGISEEDLGEVKTGVKENAAGAKAKASNDTAEKVVMKTLNTDDKGQAAKASTPAQEKSTEELELDKRLIQELDPEKKAETVFVKEELRVHKAGAKQNGDHPAFNLLHESPKEARPVNDVKVKQTMTNHQLLEQYEVIRDRINENVENGIKFLMTKGESKVTIQLKPPELGKVQMELVIKDNQVSARINTENTAVKEVIMSNLDQLKTNLAEAGHTIDKFDVEVGGFKNHFDQHFGNDKTGGGKGNGKGKGSGQGGDGEEAMKGKIINHQAVSYYLGRSINVII